jgi:hypothetical protein
MSNSLEQKIKDFHNAAGKVGQDPSSPPKKILKLVGRSNRRDNVEPAQIHAAVRECSESLSTSGNEAAGRCPATAVLRWGMVRRPPLVTAKEEKRGRVADGARFGRPRAAEEGLTKYCFTCV